MPAGAALGDDHAVAAEGGDGADDRAEVARVGDAVEGDDQRLVAVVVRGGREVLGVRVLVRRDLEDQALVVEPVGHAVELGARGFHQVDVAALAGELEGLADALVVVDELLDVEGGGGNAVAQRLEDRVAADDHLAGALGAAAAGGGAALGGLAGHGVGDAVRLVLLAVLGLGRGALAFQALAPLATAADRGALLVGRAAVPALAVPGHDLYLFR